MILPTKYLKEHESLIGISGIILLQIKSRITVSALWDAAKEVINDLSFDRFILALDFLFLLNLIELQDHEIKRISHD